MIYLDSAATSLLKPPSVSAAMAEALRLCASPGRGSHEFALRAAETAMDCRVELAALFNMRQPENVVFTMNATHALNIAIRSLVTRGDRVVVSGWEHNSVMRPLTALGADITVAGTALFDRDAALRSFRSTLPGADACVCTHVSNVFGFVLPVEDIAALCRYYGVPLVIDASQSAGALDIDFSALGAEFIAMPGHKGLLGPQGTGVLLCRGGSLPLLFGGTGSRSASMDMPPFLPDRLEAGTHNIPGIAGLLAGVREVRALTPRRIGEREDALRVRMAARLSAIPGVRVFAADDGRAQAGVLSFTVDGADCEWVAAALGERGVAIRSGLHCSPLGHGSAGTLPGGTARMSFSPYNTPEETDRAADILSDEINLKT